MSVEPDFYAVLGINPTASQDEVRSAFRASAKENHPDRFASYVQRAFANERMRRINEAYAVLRDPIRRADYDTRRRVEFRQATHASADPSSSSSRRWVQPILWAVSWIVASGLFAYFTYAERASRSTFDLLLVVLLSLMVTPLLFMVVAFPVGIVALVVGQAFRESFSWKAAQPSKGPLRLVLDLALRVGGVAISSVLLVKAYEAGIESELPYLFLLACAASLLGELAAMALYFTRRRSVVSESEALLRI